MAATNNISVVLDLLIVIAAAVFYTGFLVWINYRTKDLDRAEKNLRAGAWLIGFLGVLIGIFAYWAETTFPLTSGSSTVDNVLFYDPLFMLAFLTVAFAVSITVRFPTQYFGVLGVVIGCAVIYYGVHGYQLGLSTAPTETVLLYGAFGTLSLLLYIPTLFIDWFVVGPKVPSVQPIASGPIPAYPRMWTGLLGLFLAVTAFAGVMAIIYGFSTVWTHV